MSFPLRLHGPDGDPLNRSSPPLSKTQVRGRPRHRRKPAPARDVASAIPTTTSVEASGTAVTGVTDKVSGHR